MSEQKKPNRLAREKSPYLLQHADNPVDWYPWGEEAFEKAARENKPIFLSIGYSTCHWCHVMAHESFEDPEVGRLMNAVFVSIKVDREECPEIDLLYMTVCQMVTGSGGWPLTIIMTPDRKPFFAGTYIPRETRFGRLGLMDLIPRIREIWATRKDEVLNTADQIIAALQKAARPASGEDPGEDTLRLAYQQLRDRFDKEYGGFGDAPKFPTAHNLSFLLRYWKRTGDSEALAMVEKTLQAIRRGGIYDHVGFGFHRYSTDRRWLVPHFEKMLYDQALLAVAYIEAFQAAGKEEYALTAREIYTYLLRDMTDDGGGFYSAEDADSEGEEGKFYLWTPVEIREDLAPEEADFIMKVFNINENGNFTDEAAGRKTGRNILNLAGPLPDIAAGLNLSLPELRQRLESARQTLFDYREKRVHPHKDDKVLSDWNGLMIAALAKGARVLDEPAYADAARRAVDFIFGKMIDSEGRLLHRYRDGEAAIPGHLDDYAFLIHGLFELYETTFNVTYLEKALTLNAYLLEHFWDGKNGGFYFTADDGEGLLVRQKEIYDGAIPSGNSIAMLNLLRLGRITASSSLEEKAAGIGRAFVGNVRQAPSAYTQLMIAVDFAVGPSYEVVIAGDWQAAETREMLQAIRSRFIPNKVIVWLPPGPESSEVIRLAPFTTDHKMIQDRATAYVCTNYECKLPTTNTAEMLSLLGSG
jgi:uncharacterized protein YyaL (SSP411 family)